MAVCICGTVLVGSDAEDVAEHVVREVFERLDSGLRLLPRWRRGLAFSQINVCRSSLPGGGQNT